MRKLILPVLFSFILFSCSQDQGETNTIPAKLSVNIPDNLSSSSVGNSRSTGIDGEDIYENLRVFVHVGEQAAEVVEALVLSLHVHKIDHEMEFSFDGDDGRRKNLVVVEDVVYDGQEWDLKLTIKDRDSDNIALQMFWNEGIEEGIAIMSPFEMNHNDTQAEDLLYKVDYTEVDADYEARMIVSITGKAPNDDQWGIDKIKMFVGRNGSDFELFGNSNHPNASSFFSEYPDGASYCFTAKSDEDLDIAVANVAITSSSLSSVDSIFDIYNFESVFIDEVINDLHASGEIDTVGYTDWQWNLLDQQLETYLTNVDIPAYFNSTEGFIGSGDTLLTDFTVEFVDLSHLMPYVPSSVKNLEITFDE